MTSKSRKLTLAVASLAFVASLVCSFGGLSVIGAEPTEPQAAVFEINEGASVRLSTGGQNADTVNGIRFSAYVTKAYYDTLTRTTYPTATQITMQSTISKVVEEGETAPTPFCYEWDMTGFTLADFDENGVATFYHTLQFDSLTGEYLEQANAFDLKADFWIEVTTDSVQKVEADNADTVDVTRSMRQVAYAAYTTPSTTEKPNPDYQDERLEKYFTLAQAKQADYDMDVKTKPLSALVPTGVTVDKAYLVDGETFTDVTGKRLIDVFTEQEIAKGTTKQLVLFDESNTAYPVQTRLVTKIIDTQTEATAFFNTTTNNTVDKAFTGYYLLGADLNFAVNLYSDRYFKDGVFDGDGHTLTVAMGANHYVGLFGRISNVTVKNVELNITRDFSSSTKNRVQRDSILGYKDGNASRFENVQLNLSRAQGDTDVNYTANDYPGLYLVGNTSSQVATAKNMVIHIAGGTLSYASSTIKSIYLCGFASTENCYVFSDKSELLDVASGANLWKIYESVSAAVEQYQKFVALVESNYWTFDKVEGTLTFGKVVVVPEEPENGNTGGSTGDYDGDYNPVVRFVVTSDVHIRRYDLMNGLGQLDKVYSSAYAFAGNTQVNSGYNKLDGIFVVGDLTNYETTYEYPLYFDYINENTREGTLARSVMGNHEFSQLVYSGNGNSWSNAETIKTATDKFLAASGYESEDYHAVINGYHFLFVSMDRYGKSSGTQYEYISSGKLAWLEEQLNIAVADDKSGTKPIFVFQHVHAKDTVGSSSGGDGYLKALLDKYPNVVDFSGHTHKPISDPRSIWQGTFTAFNTGSMAYLSQNIRELGYGAKAINDTGEWASDLEAENTERDGGLYYICEVDANNVMRVFVYDTFTDSVFGEPILLDSFGDTTGFDYTAERETNSTSPEFAETDEITLVSSTFNRVNIQFPQASGDDLVENYRIEIYKGTATTPFKTEYRLSGACYGNAMPETMSVTLAALAPSTTYTIKVYAINYWLKVSQPLVKEITTASAPNELTPDIASVTFTQTGGVDSLGGEVIQSGSSTVVYDDTLEKYVGSFNADGAYKALNLADWYSAMKCGFTVETYVKITQAPTSGKYALASCNDSGGVGLYYTSEGKYALTCYFGETAYSASYEGTVGEWTHVVGIYDGSALKLYLNGTLAATTTVSGMYRPPRLLANYLAIGADPYYVNDGLEYKSKSSIALVNMYGYALTAEQVLSKYQGL